MINYFIEAWDKYKSNLKEYFETHRQEDFANDYESILKVVVDNVINKREEVDFNNKDIRVVDFGDYQGTQIFSFHVDCYQPTVADTFYTSIYYGSCSGCDTLLRIRYNGDNSEEIPNKEQVNDYMKLALNLIQNIKCYGNVEESKITWGLE